MLNATRPTGNGGVPRQQTRVASEFTNPGGPVRSPPGRPRRTHPRVPQAAPVHSLETIQNTRAVGKVMCKIRLRLGPLDGLTIDLGDPAPERVAIGLTVERGGPGTALYDLDRDREGRCYRFAGWQDEETDDDGPDGE